MSKEKEHFERVLNVLAANGSLSRSAAHTAIEGYDNAVAEIETFEKLKAEDERPTVPEFRTETTSPPPAGPTEPGGVWPSPTEDAIAKEEGFVDLGIDPEPELTRDGEVKPRTKSKHSK